MASGPRLRFALAEDGGSFAGPVDVDATYIGGKETNKHGTRKLNAGRGAVGKTAVVGARGRATGKVSASVVGDIKTRTLQDFVSDNAAQDATVYTDDASYHDPLSNHKAVKHSIKQ
jgi:transposase-like protein